MRAVAQPVGFHEINGAAGFTERLAIGTFGEASSGKTTFGLTMPDPIGVIALDRKTRPVLLKGNRTAKKRLLFPEDDFIRHADPLKVSAMQPSEAMEYYTAHVRRIQKAIYTLAERKDVESVIIDSGTQLFEDMMMMHFGRTTRIMPRDRGPLNADMRDVFNSLQGKHLLVTHQAKDVWRNERPTGRSEPAGWPALDYYCNVILEHLHDDKSNEFSVILRLCQNAPELVGQEKLLTDDNIAFDMLQTIIEGV